jgi:chromosomal replication initiation ATPase DnaA
MTEAQKTFEAIRAEWRNGGLAACLAGTDVWPVSSNRENSRVVQWRELVEKPKSCTMNKVDWAVSRSCGISVQSLHSKRRALGVVRPRWLSMLLMYEHCTQESLSSIGRFYNFDHSTVMYGNRRMKKLIANDPDWLAMYDQAQDILAGMEA